MVDSKVIGMRKTSMVDGNSNTNKEPDSTRKHSSLWASLCAPLDIVPLLPLSFFLFFGLSLFFWEISTFLFYFFDIFPLLRSTKAVTTENMSSNKCKTWPVEFSENWMKIDKNLVTTKRGSCNHFLANLKIPNPSKAGDGRIRNFFLIDLHIWNVENGVRMRKLDQF